MNYLREIQFRNKYSNDIELSIFEGDIKKDKKYWLENHPKVVSVRYFKLIEVRE